MAIEKYTIEKDRNSMAGLSAYETTDNGGPGSGNFGHAGRPGKRGGSAPEGGLSMDSHIVDIVEEMGWSVEEEGDDLVSIRKYSDAGEDFSFTVAKEGFVKSVRDYAEDFDPEEHAQMWIDNPGHGQPDEKVLREDAKAIKEDLAQLARATGEGQLAEIRKGNQEKREAEAKKTQSERAEHIKQIDKVIGKEKISEGKTKAEDDKNYKKLERDIEKIEKILSQEKSRENFGQEEARKLREKYSDYMSGNWSVTGRFQTRLRQFEDWADNYVNNSLENVIANAVIKALNGGKGSGNFGHSGRPGKVGGSASGGAVWS